MLLCSIISIWHLKRNVPSCFDGHCILGGYILPSFQIFPFSDSDSALYWSCDFHCYFPIWYYCPDFLHLWSQCSGTENTVGRKGRGGMDRGREGGKGRRKGREGGKEGGKGGRESDKEKEGKEQKKNGEK